MDYKYIEQLLERYWECQTTLEEEAILRNFFAQADIPASLLPYADLFLAEETMAKECSILELDPSHFTEEKTSTQPPFTGRAKTISISQRLRPFWRAAAVVAIVLTIGMAAQQGFEQKEISEPAYAEVLTADSTVLFTSEPQPLEQTEAVLTKPQKDTLVVVKQ